MRFAGHRSRQTLSVLWLTVVGLALVFAQSALASVDLGITTSPPLDPQQVQAYTAAAGEPPKIEMWFTNFGAPLFWSSAIPAVESVGATPMVSWDPMINGQLVPFAAIADGYYDSYIASQALLAKQARVLIYVRFAHEMNEQSSASPWGPGTSNTAATFVAAWQHVVSIFRQEGATNVKWVWAPNVYCGGQCPFTAYYPGDSWVDYVALDGYNFAATDNVPWMTLAQIFGPSYDILTALSPKPVMFTETASTELGGDKASWITQGFLNAIPSMFPRVVAVIWWERNDTTNWEVDSSSSTAAAWRSVAMSSYYGGPRSAPAGISDQASGSNGDGAESTSPGGASSGPSTASGEAPAAPVGGPGGSADGFARPIAASPGQSDTSSSTATTTPGTGVSEAAPVKTVSHGGRSTRGSRPRRSHGVAVPCRRAPRAHRLQAPRRADPRRCRTYSKQVMLRSNAQTHNSPQGARANDLLRRRSR